MILAIGALILYIGTLSEWGKLDVSAAIENENTATSVIDDNRTYEQSWRSPRDGEYLTIGRLMVKNNIKGCGEYHIKEIENSEFIIACSRDGENWTYYVAWPDNNKIYLASEEMEKRLKPPY